MANIPNAPAPNALAPTGWRLIPVWFSVAVVTVTALSNAGAVSATFGNRISDTEKRLDVIEHDREIRLRDYEQFKADIRSELAEIRTDLNWIRHSIERSQGPASH